MKRNAPFFVFLHNYLHFSWLALLGLINDITSCLLCLKINRNVHVKKLNKTKQNKTKQNKTKQNKQTNKQTTQQTNKKQNKTKTQKTKTKSKTNTKKQKTKQNQKTHTGDFKCTMPPWLCYSTCPRSLNTFYRVKEYSLNEPKSISRSN